MALATHLTQLMRQGLMKDYITLSEKGGRFLIDENTVVDLEQRGDTILFSCRLGSLPEEEEVLMQLLYSNLGGRGTLGFRLAYDSKAKELLLLHQVTEKDYQSFYDQLEDFLNSAEYWSHHMRELDLLRHTPYTTP